MTPRMAATGLWFDIGVKMVVLGLIRSLFRMVLDLGTREASMLRALPARLSCRAFRLRRIAGSARRVCGRSTGSAVLGSFGALLDVGIHRLSKVIATAGPEY
jgi:hypothetical protein